MIELKIDTIPPIMHTPRYVVTKVVVDEKGVPTKPPTSVVTGHLHNCWEFAPDRLVKIEAAIAFAIKNGYQFIGYCLAKSALVCVDLDNCFQPNGELKLWAKVFVDTWKDSIFYAERSPGVTHHGVHLWLRCNPKDHAAFSERLANAQPRPIRKVQKNIGAEHEKIELFWSNYVTVTGVAWGEWDGDALLSQDGLDRLYRSVAGKEEAVVTSRSTVAGNNSACADLSLKKQEMMTRTDFPDLSPVVMSLVTLLMEEHLFDRQKVEAEFKQSKLYTDTHWGSEKWGRLGSSELDKAAGYARENIAKRLAGRSEEEIPVDVDLNAPDFVEEPGKRLLFPESCMYGKAGELARKTETDPGYSYLSVLVMAAGRGIEPHKQVRPTLYGANLGDVGWGKSLAMQRAGALFGFPTEASPCIERFPESYEPDGNSSLFLQLNLSSDRGLYKAFEGETKARPAIIAIDELRNLLAKSNIENACLFTVLCSLYNLDEAGYADKKTKETIRVRLSLLGCLKVADENEFPTVFTHATSSGFYDRMLFGLVGKRVVWRPWYPGPYKHVEFSTPVIPEWVFKSVEECFGSKGNRFAENALRVTYITSAINGDTEVGVECVIKAMRFMAWQERLRNVFKPAKGANEHQECVDTVVAAFRESPGRAANWSKVARKNRWDRKFPRSLSSVKRLLEDMGRLTKDKATGKHFLREEF